MQEDKRLDPNDKQRWGVVLGADGQASMAGKTVGETGGVDTIITPAKDDGAVRNGGGDTDKRRSSKSKADE